MISSPRRTNPVENPETNWEGQFPAPIEAKVRGGLVMPTGDPPNPNLPGDIQSVLVGGSAKEFDDQNEISKKTKTDGRCDNESDSGFAIRWPRSAGIQR